jgi:colanic acid biosynthesis glycosyl transferase WcaI
MSNAKRILISTIFYHPEPIGISKYSYEMATWLAGKGYDVRVITAFPFYPEWVPYAGYKRWWFKKEKIEGVTVIRCPLWVPKKVNGFTRLIHLFTFGCTSSLALLGQIRWRPDVVLSVMPTISNFLGIWGLGKLSRSIFWLHVQDFEVDLALNIISKSNSLSAQILKIEKLLYHRFHKISSISNTMVNRLVEDKGVFEKDVVFFPNWVDSDLYYPLEQTEVNYRAEWGLTQQHFVVMYSGNLGKKYDFETLVQAISLLQHNLVIRFVLCGDGAAREDILKLVTGLNNVQIFSLQPVERLNELINSADAHILPQKPDAEDSVMPSKLLNIFAAAKPVIATVYSNTELGLIISKVGVVTEPGNAEALAKSIEQLAEKKHTNSLSGASARAYVIENFEQEIVLNRFLAEIKSC